MKRNCTKKITWLSLALLSSLFITAQSNQYLHFDGVDDYVELANGSQYVSGESTISMAGWFYTDALVYGQGMMSFRGGGTGDGQMYVLQLDNGVLECRVITNTGLHQFVAPVGSIQAGEWQHIAWVFNETLVELFIDGVSIGSSSASGTFQSADRPFTIGKSLESNFNFVYGGGADEVSLWSKALTQVEIQDMMANELTGNESGLEVYYKFNQGTPEGNNTGISQLLDESGMEDKHATLNNFNLSGDSSNFLGELGVGQQVISFPPVPNKLATNPPFVLEATASSGLNVLYEVISGPATVNGNTLTLDGTSGEVTVKASQSGNSEYDPATDVYVNFQVLDPQEILVETEVLHPLTGNVHAPNLIPIKIAIQAGIDYPELFSVANVEATIDDTPIELTDHENGFYTGWWTPTDYGIVELEVNTTNNYGEQNTNIHGFTLVDQTASVTMLATDEAWVNADVPSVTVTSELPSHIGAFNQITGTLFIDCPPGGCDPWDRISSIEVQGKNGEWYEIIRYLTPYGVSCQSEIDLTDFSSLLSGKTKFRVNLGTQGNGFEYTLQLNYQAGIPDNPYSTVKKLWYQTYQFGDPANLQPTEDYDLTLPGNTETAKIKLVSSGHGWGENNTGNAAEFQANTHHIWVDGEETFEQFNWAECDPNPDSCSPQNGTWYYDRAGWCPGSIAQFFDFDMGPYSQQESVNLQYIFDESYVDYCHPNNPDCQNTITCPNCDDGFNPHLIVSSYLISFGNSPLDNAMLGTDNLNTLDFNMYPNPSAGQFYIALGKFEDASSVRVHNVLGDEIQTVPVQQGQKEIKVNLSGYSTGIYLVSVRNNRGGVVTKKLILE